MRTTLERLRSAVEMPGPWKTWKTRLRFPTFPSAPWKSQRRDSHIPTAPATIPSSRLDGKMMANKNSCRNRLRQGINHVFWVGLLWPVMK